MIDLDLKKKIANTLSLYELKCEKLQLQINTLKNAINELFITPGINYEKDEHFSQLQVQLDAEFDPVAIDKKVRRLVNVIDKLEKKKAEKKRNVTHLIKESTHTLNRLALKSQDKHAVSKLQKMLDAEGEHDALITQLNEALTLCASSVLREIEDLKLSSTQLTHSTEISVKVNQSLQQLLAHLSIPENLDKKRDTLKIRLDEQLNGDNLSKLIDGLTELVVDAFNLEQKRFKGFLQELTNQLQDFNMFLNTSSDIRTQALDESCQLENAIQGDIEQIRNHIDSSKTIEELSTKVYQNLTSIGEKIKEFRANEQYRDQEYLKQLDCLKSKLNESEQNAEEIKSILNHQKYKINHDSLTGLPNRESYDEYILELFQRWQQKGKPFSLAVGDIDHFKQINDTFGHLAGDKVLKKVASIFRSSIRETDYIARYGGEEFVLIFEETTSKSASSIVEKLRKSVEECLFIYRDNKVDVTVSFGLTTILNSDNIESLFIRADNALYEAKDAGRNRSLVI
jgi:diguanylate cyclase (GGDEF)-like protein